MKNLSWLLLGIILVIAFAIRIVAVDSNPPAMHADEADTGYTAYSIIKTLKDPYGNFLPLQFQGQANNFRSPLYTYLTIPSVAVFGLSSFSTRFPSVLIGVVFVLVMFLLAKKLSGNLKVALSVAVLAAINPWSIHISRTGLEVNLCVLIITAGITSFLHFDRNKWYLVLSFFLFALSAYAYHPAKIAAPLLLVTLIVIYAKKLYKLKTFVTVGAFIFAIVYGYMLFLAAFSGGATEFDRVNIFDPSRAKIVVDEQRTRTYAPLSISSIASNKPMYYAREITNRLAAPLSFNYLFLNGENNLDKGLSNYGQYHLFEVVLVFLGLFALAFKRRILLFLALWLIIGILPGSITKTGNYAYRDVVMLPVLTIIAGFGSGTLLISKKMKQYLVIFIPIFLFSFSYYLYIVFAAYPYYSRDWWGYSQKEALAYIDQKKVSYENVYIQGGYDWVILYAFYNKIDPTILQNVYKTRTTKNGNTVAKIYNISVGNIIEKSKSFKSNNIGPRSLVIVPGDFTFKERSIRKFIAYDTGVNLKAYETSK